MMNLLGMVTFGNLEFTKLAIESIKATTKNQLDFIVIVGKPGDWETKYWLDSQGIPNIMHKENLGFPYSINDIYDYAWKEHNYDNLIIAGNDIVAYPYAIDSLINLAKNSDYEVISALQYDVKSLINGYPETAKYFRGDKLIFDSFSEDPWNVFLEHISETVSVANMQMYDIQNLCLYKRSVFDKIGYTDVNFYPAYYIDNDYARRIVISGIRCCTITSARFFHFWSRTINQEIGGSTHKNFKNNKDYYISKWGGDFGKETKRPDIKIHNRDGELQAIRRWRSA